MQGDVKQMICWAKGEVSRNLSFYFCLLFIAGGNQIQEICHKPQ
jgi:hypothetical protein